jgi:hypothetical protein
MHEKDGANRESVLDFPALRRAHNGVTKSIMSAYQSQQKHVKHLVVLTRNIKSSILSSGRWTTLESGEKHSPEDGWEISADEKHPCNSIFEAIDSGNRGSVV